MQHIKILAVGKAGGFYASGIAEYAKRLKGLCSFEAVELQQEAVDEKKASSATIAAALEKEGLRILAAVPKGALLVALCVEGELKTTQQFCHMLEKTANLGVSSTVFAIGSSFGLSCGVKTAATHKISLGKMTMPHQMARLLLTEQIYRAMMLRSGRKYDK